MLKQKYFNGRISDGRVFRNSPLPKALSGNTFGIPNARYAEPGRELPHVFVVDDAFPLKKTTLSSHMPCVT